MREIPLNRRGKNKGKYVAIVDDEDYGELVKWNWTVTKGGKTHYAIRTVSLPNGRHTSVLMHRHILGLKPGDRREVDHVNHHGLDNRRANIRVVTTQENQFNQRSVIGCYYNKRKRKFQAQIMVNGRHVFLGLYPIREEGHQAYLDAKSRYHKIEGAN